MKLECNVCNSYVETMDFATKKELQSVMYGWKCPICGTRHSAMIPSSYVKDNLLPWSMMPR